jgi:hypothetical protein
MHARRRTSRDASVRAVPRTASHHRSPVARVADGAPHENGREYVVPHAPDDVANPLRVWLCPRSRQLAKLLERHQLTPALPEPPPRGAKAAASAKAVAGLPWLKQALAECGG